MVLRKGDPRLIQRMRLKPGVHVPRKGKQRRPLGQTVKVPKTPRIQLGKPRRELAVRAPHMDSRFPVVESRYLLNG